MVNFNHVYFPLHPLHWSVWRLIPWPLLLRTTDTREWRAQEVCKGFSWRTNEICERNSHAATNGGLKYRKKEKIKTNVYKLICLKEKN